MARARVWMGWPRLEQLARGVVGDLINIMDGHVDWNWIRAKKGCNKYCIVIK